MSDQSQPGETTVKQVLHKVALVTAIAFTGCGDDTVSPSNDTTTTTVTTVTTTAVLTHGASQTSNNLTDTVGEVTSGATTSDTTVEGTTSQEGSSGTGGDSCEPCSEVTVTRQQVAMDMGATCEELFGSMACKEPNSGLNKAQAAKLVSNFLEKQGKLVGCEKFVPPSHPDVEMGAWFFQYIRNLHCVGILPEMDGQNFCPGSLTCQGWWFQLWSDAQMVP